MHLCEQCGNGTFRHIGQLGCRNHYTCNACGWPADFLVDEDPLAFPEDDLNEEWDNSWESSDEEEPEWDGQPDEMQEWHDFDPDC